MKKSPWKFILYLVILVFTMLVGIMIGINIGTYSVIDHVAYGLAGSTFIINFNETRLVNEMTNKFIPAFNKTLYNNLQLNQSNTNK